MNEVKTDPLTKVELSYKAEPLRAQAITPAFGLVFTCLEILPQDRSTFASPGPDLKRLTIMSHDDRHMVLLLTAIRIERERLS